jgi:gliding motility-associated-like protein
MKTLIINKKQLTMQFATKCIGIVMLLLMAPAAWSQDFAITVTPTDETCPGNGSLAIVTENADPNAPVNYLVYLLPDTDTAIYENTNPNVPNLVAGTYLVMASQTVNGVTQTDQQQVTVNDGTTPLTYTLTPTPEYCGYDGGISVVVTSGTATSYQILSGPVVVGPQTSNYLANLTAGTYIIGVTDECGTVEVTSYQLFTIGVDLHLNGPSFPDLALIDCDHLTMTFAINPSDVEIGIHYPLQAHITVYPPDGSAPLIYDFPITAGLPEVAYATTIIPFYPDTDFYVDCVITDPCGEEYKLEHLLAHQLLQGLANFPNSLCGMNYLEINVFKYGSPYTITFTNTPEGFDPEALNPDYPGPFTEKQTLYGDDETPVPWGTYEYLIEDSCGRSYAGSFDNDAPEEDPEPEGNPSNHDCATGLGNVIVFVPNFDFETATFVVAPDEYPNPLPDDVSEFINTIEGSNDEGRLQVNELPPGNYTVDLVDTCGNPYTYDFVIPEYDGESINLYARPDCVEGRGSIAIPKSGTDLIAVAITNGPPEFSATYPVDVSYNINTTNPDYIGSFYMDDLPPGTYTFKISSQCITDLVKVKEVPAYAVTLNEMDLIRHCGSFDFSIDHASNSVAGLGYWLQYYEEDAGQWGDPTAYSPLPEGSELTDTNSFEVELNQVYYNQVKKGQYRILKTFSSFGNGGEGEGDKTCFITLQEFPFYDDLVITDIINLTCTGDVADVQVNATGVEPLTYKITSKNNEPFTIDNGQNKIFPGLESAIYIVEVTDPCGNVFPMRFNVADLPSLVNAYQAPDLVSCDIGNDGEETFFLTTQSSAILGTQDLANVTLTYHSSQTAAQNGTNPISTDYVAGIGTVTIYARVERITDNTCFDLTSFHVTVRPNPELNMDETYAICEDEAVTITADSGYDSYEWSNGATTPSITVSGNGSYTLTVTDQYGCEGSQTVQVISSSFPHIHSVDISDWTDSNNVITVIMEESSSPGNFEYSLDNITYQSSNTFTGLLPGIYTIYVRDLSGCGSDGTMAYLLTYPKFFTPNGDGINETWRIQQSILEPDMLIYIYDRYGKLITGFGPNSAGWDGTLNGRRLPATDYWFVVKRQNGKEYKGHFSMLR